ncbi:MAG: hypothetical protein LBV74_15810 [Tannerella sp.]|jgi:hypothetical protein|nr:hypothetical protein [Tannerella sp.]
MTLLFAQGDVIDFFYNSDYLDSVVAGVTFKVCCVALTLSIIFFLATSAWNVASSSIKRVNDGNAERFFDKQEMVRSIFLIVCIIIYMPLTWSILGGCEIVCSTIVPSEEIASLNEQVMKIVDEATDPEHNIPEEVKNLLALYDDPNTSDEDRESARELLKDEFGIDAAASHEERIKQYKPNTPNGLLKVLYAIMNILSPATWVRVTFSVTVSLLLFLIRTVITFFTVNLIKVLVCIGPMSFAFSIIPAFRDKIVDWFSTLLNAAFVFFTMNVLEAIVYAMMWNFNDITQNPLEVFKNTHNVMAMEITIIILYFMAFWITSKYVGKSDAGRVITKAVTLATMATMAILTAGTGAAGAAGTGAIANTTRTAGDAFKGE